MNKIKFIIAREGLIILGLAALLYVFISFFLQKMPVAMVKYRLEFANGQANVISINPEIRNDYDYKKLLEQTYDPPPDLIQKRINEFIKSGNIKSALKSFRCVNTNQIYLSRLYSRILGAWFIFKLAIVYIILLLARFIFWSVKILKVNKKKFK